MSSSQEKNKFSPEKEFNPEALQDAANERREQLREALEKSPEKNQENLEDARREALENASSAEEEKKHEQRESSPAERRTGPISKEEREASYKATMNEIQTHMSPTSRAFSKIIHNKAVEKTSEAIGNTVARPNAILAGSLCAFVLTLGVYLLAKNIGHELSGFETIGAFILGWIIGIGYDFIKTMITGRS